MPRRWRRHSLLTILIPSTVRQSLTALASGKPQTQFHNWEIPMKSFLVRSATSTVAGVLLITCFSACKRGASSTTDDVPDTSTYRPVPTPKTEFEQKLKFVRDAHFTYIWVFARK